MKKFNVFDGNSSFTFVIENEAFEGVKEIGKTVAEDIKLVTDVAPKTVSELSKVQGDRSVVVATLGNSSFLDAVNKAGLVDIKAIEGKREVFMIKVVDFSLAENKGEIQELLGEAKVERALLITGSDKRGTIYGMFHLSELCGVSPLVYFGDAFPEKKSELEIEIDENVDGAFVSKEPSVYYRGFFINDEWPAFGNWATDTFGGVNAKCYKKIFELLLRLKGNYMWPAMWNSNFSEDGPGLENARLADMYGVVMGTSHHEPLCRAGNEWQQQYKKYGDDNTWSFVSNEKAITKFWEDGTLRNKDFENVFTIGMRGEADSKLLSEDATMKDNIEVVKKAIRAQNSILKKYVSEDLKAVPRMLAIYKEVEDYYYGDSTCEGLKDWDELENVIFLLSDDNHGNLRNLPTEAERKHAGGYGMYYHFDYHGAPISYEWTNCNRLTKTWEQMTTAYEAGVTKMWIVNVGDLKEMEYPLSFFMELAYDYETWGKNGLNRTKEFAFKWIDKQFGSRLTDSQKKDVFKVIEGYTRYNALRTPETMNEKIYNPVNFKEGERVLADVRDILETADKLNSELTGEALLTYQSIIYYAAAASLNLVIAWVLTSMNHELAEHGSLAANSYVEEIEKRVEEDKRLVGEFHSIAGGKWNHCLSSAHTGFRTWNDEVWFYPEAKRVENPSNDDTLKALYESKSVEAEHKDLSKGGDYTCVRTSEFAENKKVDGNGFEIVEFLGREGAAIKAFPPMKTYEGAENAPYVSYNVTVDEAGEYDVIFYLLTRNPSVRGGRMNFYASVGAGEAQTIHSVSDHYYTEWQDPDWAQGVLTAGRQVTSRFAFEKGQNTLRIYAGEPEVSIEKFVVKRTGFELPSSYLGPM